MASNPLEQYHLTLEDLPEWMRPRQRHWDWSLWGVLLLCGVVMLPLILWNGIPANQSAQLEYYRLYEAGRNVEAGDIFPQWSQNFNRGYGSPLFLYLAPLPHLLGAWHHNLAQTSLMASFRFILALGILLNALGLLMVVRRFKGEAAGLLAVCLLLGGYPFMRRVDLGELLAYGCWLVSLGLVERLLREGRGRDIFLLSLAVAGLILAENSLSFVLLLLLGGWIVFLIVRLGYWLNLSLTLMSIWLGVMLTVFYSVPAFNERDLVTWQALHTSKSLWQPIWGFNTLLPNDFVFLGALGGAAVGGIFLSTRLRWHKTILVLLGGVLIFNLVRYNIRTEVPAFAQFETEQRVYSTLAEGYLLPAQVKAYPPSLASDEIIKSTPDIDISFVENKSSPIHYEFFATPHAQRGLFQDRGKYWLKFKLVVAVKALKRLVLPSPITLNTYYSPHWRVRVDKIEVASRSNAGLLQFDLPPNHHTVEVDFVSSSTRRWSFRVSALVLLMLILVSYGVERNRQPRLRG